MENKKCKCCGNSLPKNYKFEICNFCSSISEININTTWYHANRYQGRIEKIAHFLGIKITHPCYRGKSINQ